MTEKEIAALPINLGEACIWFSKSETKGLDIRHASERSPESLDPSVMTSKEP